METLAVVKVFGKAKQRLLADLNSHKIEIFDFDLETDKLLAPGQEGYRQIINYFGAEFLAKNGAINLRKLGKFIYQDHHKLRIFNFLLEPLLFNELQKTKDISKKETVMVFLPGLVDAKSYQNFKNILWLNWPKDEQLKEMADSSLPVKVDKFWDIQSRLFLRPDIPMKISESSQNLAEDIESWRDFLYKLGIEI